MLLHYLVKLLNYNADFNGILRMRPHDSSGKIWGRIDSSGLNRKRRSSAQKRTSANWCSGWL